MERGRPALVTSCQAQAGLFEEVETQRFVALRSDVQHAQAVGVSEADIGTKL